MCVDPGAQVGAAVEDAPAESEAVRAGAEVSPVPEGGDGGAEHVRGLGDGEQLGLVVGGGIGVGGAFTTEGAISGPLVTLRSQPCLASSSCSPVVRPGCVIRRRRRPCICRRRGRRRDSRWTAPGTAAEFGPVPVSGLPDRLQFVSGQCPGAFTATRSLTDPRPPRIWSAFCGRPTTVGGPVCPQGLENQLEVDRCPGVPPVVLLLSSSQPMQAWGTGAPRNRFLWTTSPVHSIRTDALGRALTWPRSSHGVRHRIPSTARPRSPRPVRQEPPRRVG